MDLSTVIFKKYCEGGAFEDHLKVVEETSNDHMLKAEFYHNSLVVWQHLTELFYTHHEAQHEKPIEDIDGPSSIYIFYFSIYYNVN